MGASPLWMPLCGQDWSQTAAGFLGMWVAMMAAMMAPSFAPVLWRLHRAAGARCAVTAAGYLAVWTAIGAIVFAAGAAWARLALEHPPLARALPWIGGAALALAGALQFSRWKARELQHWQAACAAVPRDAAAAWHNGLRLGLHCARSSAGLTLAMLVLGMSNAPSMAGITLAITAERLLPRGVRAARLAGLALMAAALALPHA